MIGAIIQARMSSTRLPGKVLLDIGGKTALHRVIERVAQILSVDRIVVATHSDWEIVRLTDSLGYNGFAAHTSRYDENDVLSRYLDTASIFELDTIVRITADCPLLDPEIAERVIQNFKRGGYDYYSNCRPKSTFPDGTDVEVFTFEALKITNRESRGKEREHVTPYIYNHRHEFKVGRLVSSVDLSQYRMTLDTPLDLEYIRKVYADLGDGPFGIDSVIGLEYTLTTNSK